MGQPPKCHESPLLVMGQQQEVNNMRSSLTNIAKHPTISLVKPLTTLQQLKQIHAHLLLNGTLNNPHLHAQFLATVALHNPPNLPYSHLLLRHHLHTPNLFTLNSFIRAHSKGPTPHHSFHFYNHILRTNLSPDNYTFNFLLRACAHLPQRESALSVHAAVIKRGFQRDPHVQTGLIFMYAESGCLNSCHVVFRGVECPDLVCQTAMVQACAKCGDVGFARKMFDEMPHRDPVAWNAMIAGYSQRGRSKEALELFRSMQVEGVEVCEVSMVLVLSACTQLGALDQGRWAHGYVERSRLTVTVALGTALIDMYAKCGDIDKAMEVFRGMKDRNVYTWSSAIGGLALNGLGHESLHLFSRMIKDGAVRPNEVTFISVLRGCSVVGLVEEGRRHFESMRDFYGIEPQLEHYGLMVDLYARSGRLEEALGFIGGMPVKPHVGVWSALLHACRTYGNKELGELAAKKIVELEAKNDSAYVLLSNIYADHKNWEGVSTLRQAMKARGVRKLPGCSVIEVDGEVHEFIVGDKSHPRYDEIELKLEEVSRCLRLAGYVAKTNNVLFDIEEEEKEGAVGRHSEKLAIAFGLISLKDGVPIRVVMNLRICWDCHDVAKMVSKIFDREIIVRDRNRFHHFKNGKCSCKGYW